MLEEIKILQKSEFPELLKEITDPPEHLFVRGKMPPQDSKMLCVVGSRRFSQYGKDACERLIDGLAGFPVVIVSGLALGIDSIAHIAALKTGLKTIAVPGSGLGWDVLYPRIHVPLARKIIEHNGALVSEFEEDFKATPWSFPQRNRIMAGLSHATLIIEAQERSGTLITARLSYEYNRDVLVVPSSIFSVYGKGSNRLLRDGATPVTKSADILEALGIAPGEEKVKREAEAGNLSDEEKRVLDILREPMPRDELVRRLKMPVSRANIILSAMELKGLIVEKMGEIRVD